MTPRPSYLGPLARDRRAMARARALHHAALGLGLCARALILAHTALKTALTVQDSIARAATERPFP